MVAFITQGASKKEYRVNNIYFLVKYPEECKKDIQGPLLKWGRETNIHLEKRRKKQRRYLNTFLIRCQHGHRICAGTFNTVQINKTVCFEPVK
jgi:hypothetical protein